MGHDVYVNRRTQSNGLVGVNKGETLGTVSEGIKNQQKTPANRFSEPDLVLWRVILILFPRERTSDEIADFFI